MKHYANSEEKFVKSVVAYADADDGHLFSDAKKSVKMTKDEVMNLFEKGLLLIEYSNEFYHPVHLKIDADAALVTVMNDTGNLSFYSAEHGA